MADRSSWEHRARGVDRLAVADRSSWEHRARGLRGGRQSVADRSSWEVADRTEGRARECRGRHREQSCRSCLL